MGTGVRESCPSVSWALLPVTSEEKVALLRDLHHRSSLVAWNDGNLKSACPYTPPIPHFCQLGRTFLWWEGWEEGFYTRAISLPHQRGLSWTQAPGSALLPWIAAPPWPCRYCPHPVRKVSSLWWNSWPPLIHPLSEYGPHPLYTPFHPVPVSCSPISQAPPDEPCPHGTSPGMEYTLRLSWGFYAHIHCSCTSTPTELWMDQALSTIPSFLLDTLWDIVASVVFNSPPLSHPICPSQSLLSFFGFYIKVSVGTSWKPTLLLSSSNLRQHNQQLLSAGILREVPFLSQLVRRIKCCFCFYLS